MLKHKFFKGTIFLWINFFSRYRRKKIPFFNYPKMGKYCR